MTKHEGIKSSVPARTTRIAGALALVVSCVTASASEAAPMCDAPRAISARYAADYRATADRNTWENGLTIQTEPLADATGVIVGYRNTPTSDWKDSKVVSPEKAQLLAVLIGNGPVEFSVHVATTQDSPDCRLPNVTFGEVRPVQPAIEAGATLPKW